MSRILSAAQRGKNFLRSKEGINNWQILFKIRTFFTARKIWKSATQIMSSINSGKEESWKRELVENTTIFAGIPAQSLIVEVGKNYKMRAAPKVGEELLLRNIDGNKRRKEKRFILAPKKFSPFWKYSLRKTMYEYSGFSYFFFAFKSAPKQWWSFLNRARSRLLWRGTRTRL